MLKPGLAAVLGAERFVQEITTTASLQHPHILPPFDSGTAAGFLFYVMPFPEHVIMHAPSPESEIAYAQFRENSDLSDIWLLDLTSGIETRLSSGRQDRAPSWSPDGRFVRWSQIVGSPPERAVIMSRPADLSAPATPFGAGNVPRWAPSRSRRRAHPAGRGLVDCQAGCRCAGGRARARDRAS